jgi:hypothetical protein
MVKKHFPPEKIGDSKMKTVHRTDTKYEKDLMEQLPVNVKGKDLNALVERHGAPFNSMLCDIMHVVVWSRFDCGYATTRLSKYSHASNEAPFARLHRILRYFATHPHRPIFYPCNKLEGYKELRVDYNSPNFDFIELPNGLAIVVDSEHTRDNESRKSCHCIVGLMNGVAIQHKCKQQKAIALRSTHSETIGTCDATKETLYVQDIICAFLGIDKDIYRPTPLYIDSQPCIDSLQTNTVTTRQKHIAVPTHFIHEQIENRRVELRKIGTTPISTLRTQVQSPTRHHRTLVTTIISLAYISIHLKTLNITDCWNFIISSRVHTQKNQKLQTLLNRMT